MRTSTESDEWVVIARLPEYSAEPDMVVGMLQAAGIPAMRFPLSSVGLPVGATNVEGVRVLVPPDRVEEAREVVEAFGEADA